MGEALGMVETRGLIGAIGGSNRFLGAIFTALGQVVVAPYSALVTVLLYVDLRAPSVRLER